MDEALDASRMVKAGRSIAQIRAEIDRKYGAGIVLMNQPMGRRHGP